MTAGPPDVGPPDVGPGSLIRSEERLSVGTERVPTGGARLEKFVVTETKTITVEVSREEVRLVRIGPDGSPADARDGDSLAGDQRVADPRVADPARWMVLSEEQVVVTKRVVPVERVRLETYTVAGDQQVTADVRSEQIELQTDAPGGDGLGAPEPRR